MARSLSRAAVLVFSGLLITQPIAACQRPSSPTLQTLPDRAAVIVVATAVEYWRVPTRTGTTGIVKFHVEETAEARCRLPSCG